MGRAQCVRHRRFLHDVVRLRESIADVHGAHRARRGLRCRRAQSPQHLTGESSMTEHEASPIVGEDLITRREAILRVTAILGGVALVGGTALLTGCRQENTDAPFTSDEIAYLDEIADTILPQTSTPGAKAAKTGAFMALIVTDSYSPEERKVFRQGMHKLDDASDKAYGVSFVKATPQQRLTLLNVVDREQYDEGEARR